MKLKTHINFMGEEIHGEFTPMEVLEMLDKKIVDMREKIKKS